MINLSKLKNISTCIKSFIVAGFLAIIISLPLMYVLPHLSFMFFFFSFCGVCSIIYALLLSMKNSKKTFLRILSNTLRYIAISLIVIFVISMIYIQAKIDLACNNQVPKCDYVIVLGAGLKQSKPSLTLKYRLDKAIEYLNDNQECIAVLSGGKGQGEKITEAEAMYNYIIQNTNIDKSRLILEKSSTDTTQNISYSKDLIMHNNNIDNLKIAVLTNDFHIYRSLMIMKKAKIKTPYAVVAKTPSKPFLEFNFRLREYFSIILEYLDI